MNEVYLGLGSNVGDRLLNLNKAIELLSQKIQILKKSKIYISKAVGYTDQPDFYNMVLYGKTDLSPEELFNFIKDVEKNAGRVYRFHWGPREIDIDILFYNDLVYKSDKLNIPHPRLHERDFVLLPLIELNPKLFHPVLNKRVSDLKEFMENSVIGVL
ncbi:2-amino-4-hydroxy-6-hydroxymethyldihydropteridine diphosphokinase [Sulfurihydrogenibium yellowstonense]|jgi:2-amino-4-hydroxy-6-hydroxymethyldihydropteridine pyrophosphokinase|uniref:2-amino-4-hydroxy-6-hydroxymethyldihydropteridine pyrophosphokinase n=1 Tax=Sulfurihydrogenibium yellowstonense SS-5 TaxID=432331 RepID=C4FK16_9AQUI|nr:2-amino-4-hydroxy-6-hydroxymethyldihydropteridine diphosphokinase [Sulfurihydrogenibium yellowstonense]EEP60591.1 2-amino-4-hydroxy-6-hydroxymethyldihydropteridine pyrophosphokinase [Sulfurihydrogenibium yellowstonense SS-5]